MMGSRGFIVVNWLRLVVVVVDRVFVMVGGSLVLFGMVGNHFMRLMSCYMVMVVGCKKLNFWPGRPVVVEVQFCRRGQVLVMTVVTRWWWRQILVVVVMISMVWRQIFIVMMNVRVWR